MVLLGRMPGPCKWGNASCWHPQPPCRRPRSVLSRVHAAYCGVRDRAERAEARLELAEGALAQEQAAAEAYRASGGWEGQGRAAGACMTHALLPRLLHALNPG